MTNKSGNVNFGLYAKFYDVYYNQKDYSSEVEYVLEIANKYGVKPSAVLDIGCGTGNHLIPLAKKGIHVKGVDLSPYMIEIAKKKIRQEGIEQYAIVDEGNATSYKDGQKYDLVISMFAVLGYLTSNNDFISALKTARNHLSDHGIFIFDVWFGPTVLKEWPETRIQEFTIDNKKALRLVRPEVNIVDQIVAVHYEIIKFISANTVEKFEETHFMRYFFVQEIKQFLQLSNLELLEIHPFLKPKADPSIGEWSITVVSRSNKERS